MKKVTIIIPVYNCEIYLKECLKSVEDQTFKLENIEVILINDGSKDNSLEILKKYCKKHKDWKLIDQDNKGLSEARNIGIENSTTEYIIFLDSDDTLSNDAIEILYNKIVENDSNVVIAGQDNFNSLGITQNYTTKYLKNIDNISYKKYPHIFDFVHAAGKMYKKEHIKNHRFIRGLKHEDNYFTISLFLKNDKIDMINNIVYHHRIREGNNKSITQSLNYNTFCDLLKNYEKIIKENDFDSFFIKITIKKICNYIAKYVDNKDVKVAISESRKIIKSMYIKNKTKSMEQLFLNSYFSILCLGINVYKILKG